MIFLSFDFVLLATVYFLLFCLVRGRTFRAGMLIFGGIGFQTLYGGWQSLLPAALLAVISYLAGLTGSRVIISLAIAACIGTLIFYKYMVFLTTSVFGWLLPLIALDETAGSLSPSIIPLGISFFTFEFVHYLIDVRRGQPPIRSARDFTAFAFFWPSGQPWWQVRSSATRASFRRSTRQCRSAAAGLRTCPTACFASHRVA